MLTEHADKWFYARNLSPGCAPARRSPRPSPCGQAQRGCHEGARDAALVRGSGPAPRPAGFLSQAPDDSTSEVRTGHWSAMLLTQLFTTRGLATTGRRAAELLPAELLIRISDNTFQSTGVVPCKPAR